MPRRPRKQLRTSGNTVSKKSTRPVKKGDAQIRKWVHRDDIEGDEVDDFHSARDHIILEGDDDVGDISDGDEEVFSLDIEEEESAGAAEGETEEAELSPVNGKDTQKRLKRSLKPNSSKSSSDSEGSESWGRAKSTYYTSNAALLAGKEGDEDEEEANEMEEHEARRLQARMRDGMNDGDFGLDDATARAREDMTSIVDEAIEDPRSLSISPAPVVHLDQAATLRHLEKTSPETLALAREWDDVARDLIRVQDRLDKIESTTPDALALGLSHLHHQTLLTYLTTLAFYLHLRSAIPANVSQTQQSRQIKPVLERLLTFKKALATMEDLDFYSSDCEDEWDSDASEFDEGLVELGRFVPKSHALEEASKRGKEQLEDGELELLLKDARVAAEALQRPKKRARREKIAGANGTSHGDLEVASVRKPAHKVTFDLAEPEFVPTRPTTFTVEDELDEYGEVTSLSLTDNADKKARKGTLRFHTNKIETSARRKEEARDRMGGDDDIPYRERNKDKEARVQREIEKARGREQRDLDPKGDAEMVEVTDAFEASGGKDGYYELVKRTKQANKEAKKRQYDAARLAERLDVGADEDSGGPRSLTRAILKNKGLTPRRSKSVRNPRVKKRQQFEMAKKKVGSQKAVYKGGLAGKPYGGEESGITKVVKSVKF